jgi:hypothetical protein
VLSNQWRQQGREVLPQLLDRSRLASGEFANQVLGKPKDRAAPSERREADSGDVVAVVGVCQ